MTPEERRNPKILNGSRRQRIARGSGRTVADVNGLVERFTEAQKMMKQIAAGGGMPGMPGMPGMAASARSRKGKAPRAEAQGQGRPVRQPGQARARAEAVGGPRGRRAGARPARPARATSSCPSELKGLLPPGSSN